MIHIYNMIRALSLMISLICLTGCGEKQIPVRYLIPAGYEGAVITIFGQPDFPALPIKDGFQVHEYPNDGILITSSDRSPGGESDELLEVLTDGNFRGIESGDGAGRRERFSVFGTRESAGVPTIDYAYKAIRSVEYKSEGYPVKERDQKMADALQKLKP